MQKQMNILNLRYVGILYKCTYIYVSVCVWIVYKCELKFFADDGLSEWNDYFRKYFWHDYVGNVINFEF